jgi:translation initiation factor 6 (eIF-6)
MATRVLFENSNEVGVFARVTNSYALVCQASAENFYSAFEVSSEVKTKTGKGAEYGVLGTRTL